MAPELSLRDRKILGFVARYRVATLELLQAACWPAGTDLRAVRKVTERLRRQGQLAVQKLAPTWTGYVLARRGRQTLGLSREKPRSFTEQSLPAALAIAEFCVRRPCVRLTQAEFAAQFPDLTRPGLRSSGYVLLPTDAGVKLGMFLLDRGADPRRLIGKLRRVIMQRYTLPGFAELMHAECFELIVLTGLESKRRQLDAFISRRRFGSVGVSVWVAATIGRMLTCQ